MATTLSTMEATRAHVCNNNNNNNNNNAPPVSFMTTTRWHHFLLAHSRAYRELHAERERGWTVSALDTWYAMRRKVTATTTTATTATSSNSSSNDNSTRADVTTTSAAANTTTATTTSTTATVTSAFAHIDVGVLSERYRAHMRRLARDTAPHFFRRRQAHTQQQQQTVQEQQQQQQHGHHHHHHHDDNTNSNACDDVCVDFLDLGCAPGGVSKYLTIDLQWCGVGVTLPLRDGGVGVDAALTATALHERYALLEGNVAADVSTWRCYEAAAVTAAAAGDVAPSSAAASVSHTRNTHASCVTPLQRRMLAQLQQQHQQQQQQQTQPSSSSSASSASSACRFAFVNGGAVRDFGQRYSRMLQRCSSNYDKHNNTATASSCSDATTAMTSLLRRPRCDRDGDGRVRSDTATATTTWHDEQHALPRRRTTCNVLDTAADDVCATHTSDKRDNNDGDCNNNNNTDRDDTSGDIFDGDDSVQDILPWLNLFVPQLRLALAHVADGGSMMLVYGLPQCASFFILLYALDAIVGEAHAYDDDNNNRRRTRASPTRVHVYETIHVTKSPVYVLWAGVHTPQQAAQQQQQQDDDRDDEEDEVVVQDRQRRAEAQAQLFAALDATSTTLLPVPIARLPASIAASTATTTAATSIQGDGQQQQQQQQRGGGVVQTMLSDDTPHAARVRAKRQLWMGESDVGFALAQAGFARHRRAIEAVWERARSCLCARRQRAEREVAALTSHGAVGL